METSLQTLQRQVEKETAHGLSWDTVVQLRTLQALTEVSSQVEALNKVLADILSDSRRLEGSYARSTETSAPSTSSTIGSGGVEESQYTHVHPSPESSNGKGRRGRPRKA